MKRIIETRRYVDGDMTVVADIFDDGSVRFSMEHAEGAFSLGAAVLEQLATLAHKHKTASST